MSRRPLPSTVVTAVALTLALGGCGVSTEDEATVTTPDEVPFGLAEGAPGALPPAALTAEGPFAEVYLVDEAGERLVVATRQLDDGRVATVLAALLSGPTRGEADVGLTTALPDDEVVQGVEVTEGVAAVDLTDGFAELDGETQRIALAQMVFTLTGRTGISRVTFTLEDQPVEVPRGDGTLAIGSLSRDDYRELEPRA